ncbi:hypothetical protein BV20DRAFT_86331 [Pilatotrama ljubarskyi]|nr:hypothetical protein BV20DRAFT_86331 [Pilatotrama ljubarskyi]
MKQRHGQRVEMRTVGHNVFKVRTSPQQCCCCTLENERYRKMGTVHGTQLLRSHLN